MTTSNTITKDQLLSMSAEDRKKISHFEYFQVNNNSNCSYCSSCYDCHGCSDCSGCHECFGCSECHECFSCSSCHGISNGRNLKHVYKGIQLTEEEYRIVIAGKQIKKEDPYEGKIVEIDGKKYKFTSV